MVGVIVSSSPGTTPGPGISVLTAKIQPFTGGVTKIESSRAAASPFFQVARLTTTTSSATNARSVSDPLIASHEESLPKRRGRLSAGGIFSAFGKILRNQLMMRSPDLHSTLALRACARTSPPKISAAPVSPQNQPKRQP